MLRMLDGTTRAPDEVVAVVPPDLVECTVEKVAVNAVLAGCKPEYLPVVLAAVEAACTDEFNAHGLLATTYFSGPGRRSSTARSPRAIGMNCGGNALGQGNRANATIGRALQLVIRNVGGGRPGEVDRATLGNPGKYTFCFAEDEAGSPWEPLSVERGLRAGRVDGHAVRRRGPARRRRPALARRPSRWPARFAAVPARRRPPEAARSAFDAILVVSPEHARVFREAGWDKARLRERAATRCCQLAGRRARAGRGRHRRGPARGPRRRRRCRSSGPAAC